MVYMAFASLFNFAHFHCFRKAMVFAEKAGCTKGITQTDSKSDKKGPVISKKGIDKINKEFNFIFISAFI